MPVYFNPEQRLTYPNELELLVKLFFTKANIFSSTIGIMIKYILLCISKYFLINWNDRIQAPRERFL